MSNDKQILVVFGATGLQGSSVVNSVLESSFLSSKYSIRAVTRDVNKESSKALAARGCEVVQADVDNLDQVKKAVRGAFGVFALTNYWDDLSDNSKEKEIRQGKNLIDASKAEGVKHVVYSSLPHASVISGGSLTGVKHFDSKAEVEAYAEQNKGDMICSYFMAGIYMQNYKNFVHRGPDGKLVFANPVTAGSNYPGIDPSVDTGKFVLSLFEAGQRANGARIQGVGSWNKPQEIADIIGEATGESITFTPVSPEVSKSFMPPELADEITQNLQLIGEFDYFGKGAPEKQVESDAWLFGGGKTLSFSEFVKIEKNGPWKF